MSAFLAMLNDRPTAESLVCGSLYSHQLSAEKVSATSYGLT